ncbi:hypothetical protein EV356DRAFT_513445 [Viridothelium virens]|uniref:Uncharacterized protein n=1 Tax=Viridothelium virens TaxID=1048519 RepID=A0A6A6HCL2_VIRVR|nr:hypothetical protein EV356DRAFT_513445 [Viridothelium virens]
MPCPEFFAIHPPAVSTRGNSTDAFISFRLGPPVFPVRPSLILTHQEAVDIKPTAAALSSVRSQSPTPLGDDGLFRGVDIGDDPDDNFPKIWEIYWDYEIFEEYLLPLALIERHVEKQMCLRHKPLYRPGYSYASMVWERPMNGKLRKGHGKKRDDNASLRGDGGSVRPKLLVHIPLRYMTIWGS